MKVAVIGLGKIGLPLAQVLVKHGFEVQGVEKRPISNPGFPVFSSPAEAEKANSSLRSCEIVFVIVPTPSCSDGKFDLEYVWRALHEVCGYLSQEAIVAICSTVNVGTFEQLRRVWLSGSPNIAYTPLMVAQGSVAKDLENPDYVLIGSDNSAVSEKLRSVWEKIVRKDSPFIVTSTRNMELIKLSTNFLLPAKIVLVNLIAELCEAYGGDFDEVVKPLKLDRRLSGQKMWKAGLGFGGPCFPRDIKNFLAVMKTVRRSIDLVEAVDVENERMIRRSADLINSIAVDRSVDRVAVLGVSYKPGVALTDGSQSLRIAKRLDEVFGMQVSIYDPAWKGLFQNAKDCVKQNDLIFIGVPWPEFEDLGPEDFREDQVVIDPWRILRKKRLPCKHIAYGVGECAEKLGHASS